MLIANFLVLLLIIVHSVTVIAMPYRVPLQGYPGGKRTLVLVEKVTYKQSYSMFFSKLLDRGHEIFFKEIVDPEVVLKKYGEFIYDNIILFSETVDAFEAITFGDILDFIDNGGNFLFATRYGFTRSVFLHSLLSFHLFVFRYIFIIVNLVKK